MGSYLEHLCDGLEPLVAHSVVFKDELFDGGVFLSEIERKSMVSGAANWGRNEWKRCIDCGCSAQEPLAERSADADHESLGKFDPAFVSDLLVPGHIQAGQERVHLQEVDRKNMVNGG